MTKAPKDIGTAVRARLLRLARERGEDLQSGAVGAGALAGAAAAIVEFAQAPLGAAASATSFKARWLPGGPWR